MARECARHREASKRALSASPAEPEVCAARRAQGHPEAEDDEDDDHDGWRFQAWHPRGISRPREAP